jgi:hypothetical protein
MRKESRKTTRAPTEPEWIRYGCDFHIFAFAQFWCAHLLGESRHNDRNCCRSCMYSIQGTARLRTTDCVECFLFGGCYATEISEPRSERHRQNMHFGNGPGLASHGTALDATKKAQDTLHQDMRIPLAPTAICRTLNRNTAPRLQRLCLSPWPRLHSARYISSGEFHHHVIISLGSAHQRQVSEAIYSGR